MSDPDDVATYQTFAAALSRRPDDPQMLVNHFAHLFNTVDRSKIHALFPLAARAYRIDPNNYSVAFNYATALGAVGRWLESISLFKWCVENAPDRKWLGRARHHLGIALRYNGDDAAAIEWYDKALEINNDPEIKKDRALTILAMGRLNEGLQAFECRRECAEAGIVENGRKAQGLLPVNVRSRHWQGEDLTGKTVVVYAEEGIGDFIMMSRFIPCLRDYGVGKLLLTGKVPDLLDLVADNIPVDGIVPLTEFDADHVVGSMTLPWRVGVDYQHVDGAPYFKAEPAPFKRRAALNVGLVWRGNAAYGRNSHRSMDFTNFCPLFEIPGIAFYSLQVGEAAREITAAGYDGFVANLAPFARTWRQTARLIASLDAVVSVDTAVAHLAGALGVPVFNMVTRSCDWRWNRNSITTVWYDSMRVVRQKSHDNWGPVVSEVKSQLESMVNERRQNARSDQQRADGESDRGTLQDCRRAG